MNGMFTDRVKKVMQLAREESVRLGNDYVGTEHLLLGLIREGDGVAVAVLKNLGIDLDDLARNIEKSISSSGGMMTIGQMIPFTPRAKKVLEIAAQEARSMSHKYIGTEHLLLALMKDHESAAANALASIGVEYERVKEEIERVLRGGDASGAGGAPGRLRRQPQEEQDPVPRPFRPRPHRARPPGPARSDHRPRAGDRARHPDPVAPQEEQPRAHRRAGRGQDRHRGGPGPEDRGAQHPRDPGEQARGDPGHGLHRGRHQVPRPVRGAPQEPHDRAPEERQRHHLHRRAAHHRGRRRSRKVRSTPPTSSSRPCRAASSSASAPPPWTSTASTSRRTAPWSAGSRPSWSIRPRWRTPCRSSRACAPSTRPITR